MAFVPCLPVANRRLTLRAPASSRRAIRALPLSRPSSRPLMTASTAASTDAASSLPPRVVLSPLPRLFVYDHCPFCVRARFVLGAKNVKHELVWLANDDFDTPTALIGKKMVPILQPDGARGKSVPESMDICELVDADARFGTPGLLRAASGRADIDGVLDAIAMPLRRLTRPRFALMDELPEFAFKDGRDMYVQRHPLPEPESYDENMARSGEYIAAVQARLDELAGMIHSKECITAGGLSYDDVVTFPKLRAMTCVNGLDLPEKMREYLAYQSAQTEIPLYYRLAR